MYWVPIDRKYIAFFVIVKYAVSPEWSCPNDVTVLYVLDILSRCPILMSNPESCSL